MAKLKSKFDGHYEYIWRCECHDWHFIQIEWDDNDADWRILEIADSYHPVRWRDRMVAAAKMLRGKPHYPSAIVLRDEDVADIIEVLSKHSKEPAM